MSHPGSATQSGSSTLAQFNSWRDACEDLLLMLLLRNIVLHLQPKPHANENSHVLQSNFVCKSNLICIPPSGTCFEDCFSYSEIMFLHLMCSTLNSPTSTLLELGRLVVILSVLLLLLSFSLALLSLLLLFLLPLCIKLVIRNSSICYLETQFKNTLSYYIWNFYLLFSKKVEFLYIYIYGSQSIFWGTIYFKRTYVCLYNFKK